MSMGSLWDLRPEEKSWGCEKRLVISASEAPKKRQNFHANFLFISQTPRILSCVARRSRVSFGTPWRV